MDALSCILKYRSMLCTMYKMPYRIIIYNTFVIWDECAQNQFKEVANISK